MDKKIILPFEDNPYTTVYQTGAFPMGIIQANAKDKDIIPWLCGKFINYRATTSEKFQFYINTVFCWTFLASFYLQFLSYNIWLVFLIGLPIQVMIFLWANLKPKK